MQQDVSLAELCKDVAATRRKPKFARNKAFELKVRALRQFVKIEKAREIHWPLGIEDLPIVELKCDLQTPHNVSVSVGINLQANHVTFTPAVELRPDRFKQIARLFFFEVQIAVASDTE